MSDERFARQYRYEPPPEFPLASPCTGIVHHLSGPISYAHTQTSLRRSKSVDCAKQKNPICYFHSAYRFITRTLAHMLDSLVRVSRRVGWNHLVNEREACGPMPNPTAELASQRYRRGQRRSLTPGPRLSQSKGLSGGFHPGTPRIPIPPRFSPNPD